MGFLEHINYLCENPPGDAKKWWPKYIYHYTDITNAANILENNRILSRKRALETAAMRNDNASALVIGNTSDDRKVFARFYFRPRTPTQYRNEGLRPIAERKIEAHCPVPVFFLIDSREVLTRSSTLFTDGNLAAGPVLCTSASEYASLPFEDIYHNRAILGDTSRIVYHRNAEVLVPNELILTTHVLKHVWCRSSAEYDTLLHLLSPDAYERWSDRIFQGPKPDLFFNQWTFVQDATLTDEIIHLVFNPNTNTPGPFNARIEIVETATGDVYKWQSSDFIASKAFKLSLKPLTYPQAYIARLYLDNDLAYANRHLAVDTEPF